MNVKASESLNLNTLLIVATLVVMIGGFGVGWGINLQTDSSQNKDIAKFEIEMKIFDDRLDMIEGNQNLIKQELQNLAEDMRASRRIIFAIARKLNVEIPIQEETE